MTTETGRELAARGFPVFPLAPGQKHPPLVPDWPNLATTDEAQIAAWAKAWPNANWGLHCAGLIVVDYDAQKPEASKSKAALPDFPKTLAAKTPSGGYHFFYRCADGAPNSVNKLGKGIDIRSTNGYVVGAGSAVNGVKYRWVNNDPIVEAPDWLVTNARQKLKTAAVSSPPAAKDIDPAVAVRRAKELLAQLEPAIEGQGGDAFTYSTICKARDLGVPRDRAVEVLDEWNRRCSPPWPIPELETKIANAYRYAQNAPGVTSVEAMFDVIPGSEPSTKKVDTEMYGPDDVHLSEVLSVDYLVKGWLDRGRQAMMFGKWGGGKTFCTLHMAAHIAAGESWFGNRVRQGGVLFAGYEGEIGMKRRLVALRQEFPQYDMRAFKVLPMRWPLATRGSSQKLVGQERLERALSAFKADLGAYPALVVVDPLRNALGGSDSDADLTAPYLEYLQALTKKTGAATLTLHHPGHAESDRGRGDSGIEAHMDTVIKLDGKLRTIESVKQRDDPRATLYYRLDVLTLGVDDDGDPLTTCIVRQVQHNPCDPQLTDVEAAEREAILLRADAGGHVPKQKALLAMSKTLTRDEKKSIIDSLIQKQALVLEPRGYRAGEGAAEMFG